MARRKKKSKKQRRIRKTTILFIILDILMAGCFFVFYGPFHEFRNMFISTALTTKTHGWLAHTFYSDETIEKVKALNAYVYLTDEVNLDEIVIDTSEKDHYKNKYDEMVLKREKGNNDYKSFDVKVGNYEGHMVAIYNPAKVKLITSKSFNTGTGAETVLSMCKRHGGLVCINGGRFQDTTGWGSDIPKGYLIKDSKIIWSDHDGKAPIIGFNKDNKLVLSNMTGQQALNMGIRDALEFGPFLIVNGKKISTQSGAGGYDRAARVAIAQRKDGVVLFLVTEGVHTNGPTLIEMADTLSLYGAYNAANLDGGTSSQLVVKNKLINKPKTVYGTVVEGGRYVVSGFGLLK